MNQKITPKNLVQHELIGLQTTVIKTPCVNLENISGLIVDETKNTFEREVPINCGTKCIMVPKHKNTFRFVLPINENDKDPHNRTVDINGTMLTKRPEDRIKKLAKLVQKLNKNSGTSAPEIR